MAEKNVRVESLNDSMTALRVPESIAENLDLFLSLLRTVKRRLAACSLPFVFDSGYLAAFLQKSRFSFFQSVGYT